jgi:ComF family protein
MELTTARSLAWIKGLGTAFVDLLFPPFCVACRRYGAWLCARCTDEIEVIHPPVCSRCGLPLAGALPLKLTLSPAVLPAEPASLEKPVLSCTHCQSDCSSLDGLRACAFLGGVLRLAIHQFKYEDLHCLAAPLGRLMAQAWPALAPNALNLDVIVPVPLHPTRQRERGFNQAALLASELGIHLGRPVVEGVLVRSRATSPQVGLGPDERRANVSGAFECVNVHLAGKSVLLIDDVYTTGSTMEAACAALRDGGVTSVWAYTLARAGQGAP